MRSQYILWQLLEVTAYRHTTYHPLSLNEYVGLLASITTGNGGGNVLLLSFCITHLCLMIGRLPMAWNLRTYGFVESWLYSNLTLTSSQFMPTLISLQV